MAMKSSSDAIAELVGRCDVCLVDLDQCIYPIFTQTALGALLLLRGLAPRRWRHLPRLLSGAAYILRTRAAQILGDRPTNYELMNAFCRVVRGFPYAWVDECAAALPGLGPRGWRSALERISERMPVFLLTFAIKPIASAYGRTANSRGGRIFAGSMGTPLISFRGVIEGCSCTLCSLSPAAKLKEMERICAKEGFRRPLVIGHGKDESALCARAREMGGGSIAIVRPRQPHDFFDLPLRRNAWKTIARALPPSAPHVGCRPPL